MSKSVKMLYISINGQPIRNVKNYAIGGPKWEIILEGVLMGSYSINTINIDVKTFSCHTQAGLDPLRFRKIGLKRGGGLMLRIRKLDLQKNGLDFVI